MNVITILVGAFFAVVATGPDGVDYWRDWRARRRAQRERPDVRVVYLPSACCRGGAPAPCTVPCAICAAVAP